MTTAFSQRDARWAKDQLGTCDLTIGEAGCLVSSVASILVDFEIPTDPGRLNRWLGSHRGYAGGCRFVFDAVRGLGANLVALVRCPNDPAPMERVEQALQAGCGIVALVDARPGGSLQQHWVRIIGDCGLGASVLARIADCRIMDPWQAPGQEMTGLLEHYGRPGWDAARVILGVAIYTHNGECVMAFAFPDPRVADAQEEVAVRKGSRSA